MEDVYQMFRASGIAAVALAAFAALPVTAAADENQELEWKFVPGIPRPIEVAIVSGDPAQSGPFVIRYRMPSGMRMAPHTFPDTRELTVLKGIYWIAEGESYNWREMNEYKTGTSFTREAGKPYYEWARTAVVIEEKGTGPSEIGWVNSEDDPRNRRKRRRLE